MEPMALVTGGMKVIKILQSYLQKYKIVQQQSGCAEIH